MTGCVLIRSRFLQGQLGTRCLHDTKGDVKGSFGSDAETGALFRSSEEDR